MMAVFTWWIVILCFLALFIAGVASYRLGQLTGYLLGGGLVVAIYMSAQLVHAYG